jgi:ubiquitin-protein ligase
MNPSSAARIPKELADINDKISKNELEGVIIETDPSNNFLWRILVAGPKGTPYEGGVFKLACKFPEQYPFKPPQIKFETKIYHPNVNKDNGEICQDVYEKDWLPTKRVVSIVQLIISMLLAPNIDSPIEATIADEYKNNKALYNKNAQEWTQKYAN